MSFTCNATGELPFTITWSNLDENDPSISVQDNVLTLSNVNKAHAKQYTCEVTDGINTVRVSGDLLVKCEYNVTGSDKVILISCTETFLWGQKFHE